MNEKTLQSAWRILFKKKQPRTKKPPRFQVVLMCNGPSVMNENHERLEGWSDGELSERGVKTARRMGAILKEMGFHFDVIFTSMLKRSKQTVKVILETMEQERIPPLRTSWRLNPRHYGSFTGKNADEFGEALYEKFYNDFHFVPPDIEPDSEIYKKIMTYPEVKNHEVPLAESRMNAMLRVLPFWEKHIIKEIKTGRTTLICGHRNSVLGLITKLDQLTQEEVGKVRLPRGVPFLYTFDEDMVPVEQGSCRFVIPCDDVEKVLREEYRDRLKKKKEIDLKREKLVQKKKELVQKMAATAQQNKKSVKKNENPVQKGGETGQQKEKLVQKEEEPVQQRNETAQQMKMSVQKEEKSVQQNMGEPVEKRGETVQQTEKSVQADEKPVPKK